MADIGPAFYKNADGTFMFAPNFVSAPTYELLAPQHDTYTYPCDGWYWFETEAEARAFLGIPDTSGFYCTQDNGQTLTYATQLEMFGEVVTADNRDNWCFPLRIDNIQWFWFPTETQAQEQLIQQNQQI